MVANLAMVIFLILLIFAYILSKKIKFSKPIPFPITLLMGLVSILLTLGLLQENNVFDF